MVGFDAHAHAQTSAADHQVERVRDSVSQDRPVHHPDWPWNRAVLMFCKRQDFFYIQYTATSRLDTHTHTQGHQPHERKCTQEKSFLHHVDPLSSHRGFISRWPCQETPSRTRVHRHRRCPQSSRGRSQSSCPSGIWTHLQPPRCDHTFCW